MKQTTPPPKKKKPTPSKGVGGKKRTGGKDIC